jgi:hypothetical protein
MIVDKHGIWPKTLQEEIDLQVSGGLRNRPWIGDVDTRVRIEPSVEEEIDLQVSGDQRNRSWIGDVDTRVRIEPSVEEEYMSLTMEQTALILSFVDIDRIRKTYQGQIIRETTVAEIEAIANASLSERWDDVEAAWFQAGYHQDDIPCSGSCSGSFRVRMHWKASGEAELYLQVEEILRISLAFPKQ